MDDALRLRFEPENLKNEKRTPYRGNRTTGGVGIAREGYQTLAMADPSEPYRADDRETLAKDSEYDPMMVRHQY